MTVYRFGASIIRPSARSRCQRRASAEAPPLIREHRIYQADWLIRFYGFRLKKRCRARRTTGHARLGSTPSSPGRSSHRENFPVDVNRAPKELLWRVPGLGTKAVDRILSSRRWRKLRLDDVGRLTLSITKVRPFISTIDWRPTLLTDRLDLRSLVGSKQQQLELFAA